MKVQLNSLYIFLTCATLGGILFGTSCKRAPIKNEEESETEIAITPLARPIGSVKGQASSKTIGPAGGVLSSADGQLKISIP
ncbi:hypothetical protein, partial [Sphingobacterium sp.]|uniref:hypothetical protein n=1 Tax=Sphingobacterium sp. TaxID=341027 RepID=UPI002897021A